MNWLVFAFLNACFESAKDLLIKRATGKDLDVYSLTWGLLFFSGLFYLPITFTSPIPEIGPDFYWVLFLQSLIFGCSLLLYVKALELSEVSLCVPLIMFTPLFLLFSSPLMIGEIPTWMGMTGVLLIVAGSYFLNVNRFKEGYLAPLKALVKERGPRMMLLFAFLMSITSNFDKLGLQNSSPYFWMSCVTALLPVLTGIIFSLRKPNTIPSALRASKLIIPAAIANTAMIYCHMTAIAVGLVIYVIAIKRMSAVLSVFGSSFFFREDGLRERLIAALVMLAGVVLIAIS